MNIDISQILVSKSIINAVKSINPDFNVKQYSLKLDRNPAPFPLKRMEGYIVTNIQDVLEKEPISVSFVAEKDGKKYYSIEDGRHRYAQALAMGQATIKARIV
jgi:hypothetical protein